MNKKYLMGIDVGTTGTKAIVFDPSGHAAAASYQEYSCIYPSPGWVEQDYDMLIHAVYETCRKSLSESGIDKDEIAGVSISAQRSCTLLVDEKDHPFRMISWLDNQAEEEVKEIADRIGEAEFYEITGLPLCATWMLPKILFVRNHCPEDWKKTAKIVQLQDAVLHDLGVESFLSDEPEACFSGLWDNRNYTYSEKILKSFDLDPSLFPKIFPSGSIAGKVSKDVAEKSGLAAGTLLCVGAGDQNCAALGAGVVKKGILSVSLGTGGLATALMDVCYRDPMRHAMVTSHVTHGMWTFEGLQNVAAGGFRWFRDVIAAYESHTEGNAVYDCLNRMIESVPVGAKGLVMLPYFAGSGAPRWNAETSACFLGLTLSHDRACMARACVEGITLEQKDIIRSITSDNVSFNTVRIVGGATKSEVWNQIQADIYQLPCETLEVADAAVLGAALCAGVGAGVFSDFTEGADRMVKVKKRYEPNPENKEKYEALYNIYCHAYQGLTDSGTFGLLNRFRKTE